MIYTKKQITLEQLARVRLVEPADAGALWQGVQHADLVTTFAQAITARNWTCHKTDMRAALSKDKADVVASFALRRVPTPDGFKVEVGIKHSNARRFGLSVFIGLHDQKWGTSFVLFESEAGRKREGSFDLTQRIDESLTACAVVLDQAEQILADLRHTKIEGAELDRMFCHIGSEGILPWSRVGVVHRIAQRMGPFNALDLLLAVCRQIDRAPAIARQGQMELRCRAACLFRAYARTQTFASV